MNFKIWADWVAQIDALTQGCVVELRTDAHNGMTISVLWHQGGREMAYGHALSRHEMHAMHDAVQPSVLQSITNAVGRMTPNAPGQRAADRPSAAPQSSTTPGD